MMFLKDFASIVYFGIFILFYYLFIYLFYLFQQYLTKESFLYITYWYFLTNRECLYILVVKQLCTIYIVKV
jgi:hypothetical protein